MSNGGAKIASVLSSRGTRFLFTLCGGHISPILTEAKKTGIRVIDVRDEKNAVFAADAMARLTGRPGVAAVTAGPGLTNTLTAMKNAQMAQSPVVLLGGAAATMLKGRGSLQDIDQLAVVKPHVKWAAAVRYVKDLPAVVERAFDIASSGVPGPVFVECPIDLLYDEAVVRDLYLPGSAKPSASKGNLQKQAMDWYLGRHVDRLFSVESATLAPAPPSLPFPPLGPLVSQAARMLKAARKPVLLVGSQALTHAEEADAVADAIRRLGIPVYLASGARGLLGPDAALQMRHKRKAALRECDLVILAGVPCDFRMDYGRSISARAKVIGVNRSVTQLFKNKLPHLPVPADPGRFIQQLADATGAAAQLDPDWMDTLRARDAARDQEIAELSEQPPRPPIGIPASTPLMNPLQVCRAIDRVMADDGVIIGDGGDFVATASYILRPRGPLRWLDPGAFGTLGVGGAFALAAKLARPESEVWLMYGDGAAGFSIVEFDTMVRHGIPVIAVVGNDAGWTQIARDQVVILDDAVGTVLAPTRYDQVAAGYGAVGINVERESELDGALAEGQRLAREGRPVLINANIGVTEFRKGSISM